MLTAPKSERPRLRLFGPRACIGPAPIQFRVRGRGNLDVQAWTEREWLALPEADRLELEPDTYSLDNGIRVRVAGSEEGGDR